MGNEITKAKKDNQVTGNVGLYYVCYRLSRMGWNAMPTARNARGIDNYGKGKNLDQKGFQPYLSNVYGLLPKWRK